VRLADSIIYRDRVSARFAEALVAMCGRLGVNPDYMMACMAFETGGTFDPGITNGDVVVWTDGEPGGDYRLRRRPGSSGTGLIQFMARTARGLGTTTGALAQMTATEQLAWVEKYFRPHAGKLRSPEDVYMAILCPRAVGRPLGTVIYTDSNAYRANIGLDANEDGAITKREASRPVRRLYEQGLDARRSRDASGLRRTPLELLDPAPPVPLDAPSPLDALDFAAPSFSSNTRSANPTHAVTQKTKLNRSSAEDIQSGGLSSDSPEAGIKETLEVGEFLETFVVGLVERVRDGIGPSDAVMLVLDEDIRSGAMEAVAGLGDVPGEVLGIDPAELDAVVGRFEQAGFTIARAFIGDADGEETAGIEEILDVLDFAEQFLFFVVESLKDGVQPSDAVELARDAALQEAALEAVEGAARIPVEAADLGLDEIEQLTGRVRSMGFRFYQAVLSE
jgi:hypothetical protein